MIISHQLMNLHLHDVHLHDVHLHDVHVYMYMYNVLGAGQ